jgi:hypothetical protein
MEKSWLKSKEVCADAMRSIIKEDATTGVRASKKTNLENRQRHKKEPCRSWVRCPYGAVAGAV